MDLEPFQPRFPWYGPHLQSMRNPLVRAPRLPGGPGLRVQLPLTDGDVLQARRDEPPRRRAGGPDILLVHGLGGCETSHYVLTASAYFTARGCVVYRLSLRGAGPSQATCRDWSHAGRFGDLEAAFDQLDIGANGVVAVGFSLGGCVMLNYVARGRVHPRLLAVVSVSTPLDLAAAAEVLHAPRNRLYHAYLLRALKADYLHPTGKLSDAERARIVGARTLIEVDDRFTAPRHGFRDAADYYGFASPFAHLPHAQRPTLLLHAADDPFVPAEPYSMAMGASLRIAVARGGGHLGFHDRQGLWHLRRIEAFVAELIDAGGGQGLPASEPACS